MKAHLCHSCMERFRDSVGAARAADEKGCFACGGAFGRIPEMVNSALGLSGELEWSTFSVSSSFPRALFMREEELADFAGPSGFTSIKNQANSSISRLITKATGKKNDQRCPDISFEFDFSNGMCAAKPCPIFIFGRYLKLSRNHCQSRWHCSVCRGRGCGQCRGSGQNYPSVEDELGRAVLPHFQGKECILHASGREDVDVRCLCGRPFVLEIKGAKKRAANLGEIERQLSGNPSVRAVGMRLAGKWMVDAVCNSHFDKEYCALVSADRPLGEKDAEKVKELAGQTILQNTPNRVLSRRADLERRRKIHGIEAEAVAAGRLRVRIFAEAGTYIKELISSDGGRTAPSLSQALCCKAKCDELDVWKIHDFFLETLL